MSSISQKRKSKIQTAKYFEEHMYYYREPSTGEYRLRRRPRTRVIPFGYKVWPGNIKYLEPIPDQIEALFQAFIFLDQGCSWRETARWVMKKTKRSITHMGLKGIYLRQKQSENNYEAYLLERAKKVADAKTNTEGAAERYNSEWLATVRERSEDEGSASD
jgi:hypothetical protein